MGYIFVSFINYILKLTKKQLLPAPSVPRGSVDAGNFYYIPSLRRMDHLTVSNIDSHVSHITHDISRLRAADRDTAASLRA